MHKGIVFGIGAAPLDEGPALELGFRPWAMFCMICGRFRKGMSETMKNRTDFVGIGVKEEAKQTLKGYREVISTILWAVFGFIISMGNMMMEISPFGTAVCAACPKNRLAPVTLGVAAGSLLTGNLFVPGHTITMKYVAAAVIVAVVRWALSSGTLVPYSLHIVPLTAAGSMLLPSLAVALASNFTVYDIVMSAAEAVLAGASAYFILRTFRSFSLGQGVMTQKRSDTACMIVTLCILIVSLTSVQAGGISAGRLISAVIVLICALVGGEATAAVAGIACGVSVGLALFPQMNQLGVFALAGLMAGVFSPLGKFGCAGAYVMTSGAMNLLFHPSKAVVPMLVETLIASVGFMLLPDQLIRFIRNKIFRHIDRSGDKGVKDLLLTRMADASAALQDIALTTQKVSKKLDKMKSANVGEVYGSAIDAVCQKCGLKTRCWQQEYGDTINVFNNMTSILRKGGQVTEEDITYPLSARCTKKDKLVTKINADYQDFLVREGMSRKVARVRSVVTDQFEGMSDMLRDLARELCEITSVDNRLTLKVQDYLEQTGLEAETINCYRDDQERVFIQMVLPRFKLARLEPEQMAEELSAICDCVFAEPEEIIIGRNELQEDEKPRRNNCELVRLTFREKAEYAMEFAASQHICQGANLCGDSYSTFTDRKSVAHMILSDGMGSGMAAAVDSNLTVSLITKLIDADVGYEPSLKIVNSALLVKSGEESLSTIDIAAVNLYTGQAEFYKAGAAPTFVRKGNKAGYVESTSLPVGILTAVDFEKSSVRLEPGDLVVMVSDGAVASGIEWIRNTVERYQPGDDLQALCNDIATTARLKRSDCHDDDITVVAGLMTECKTEIE